MTEPQTTGDEVQLGEELRPATDWRAWFAVQSTGAVLGAIGLVAGSRFTEILGGALLFPGSLAIPGLLFSGVEPVTGGLLTFHFAFAVGINCAIFGLYRGVVRVFAWGRTSPTAQKLGHILFPPEPPRPPTTLRTLVNDARNRVIKARVPLGLFITCYAAGVFLESLSTNFVDSPYWFEVLRGSVLVLGGVCAIFFFWAAYYLVPYRWGD